MKAPVIWTPRVQNYHHLRNVTVTIPFRFSHRPDHTRNHRKLSLIEVTADLRDLISMHLTFVTINLTVDFDRDVDSWHPFLRSYLLDTALESFKEARAMANINTEHVIYDLSSSYNGPMQNPGDPPIIAFVRREMRSHGINGGRERLTKPRYVFLGHDSLLEIWFSFLDESGRLTCAKSHEDMMRRLSRIVEKVGGKRPTRHSATGMIYSQACSVKIGEWFRKGGSTSSRA